MQVQRVGGAERRPRASEGARVAGEAHVVRPPSFLTSPSPSGPQGRTVAQPG